MPHSFANRVKVMDLIFCAWDSINKDIQFNMNQVLLVTYETKPCLPNSLVRLMAK
jgi:hypothetical protein